LNDPSKSAVGTFLGALSGYALASAAVLTAWGCRDRELTFAATSVLREEGRPESITAKVKKSHVTLGEADEYSQRQRAQQALAAVPGIAGVTNLIRVRTAEGGLSAA
jgi:hypothetical protein